MAVTRRNEIALAGVSYPILGEVRAAIVSQMADKQVVGDYTKDSEKSTSSLVSSDHRGGIGIKDMVESKDSDRSWWSTCELGFKGHLVLPPLATDCTNPTTAKTDCALLVEYNNLMYACFGTDVRSWANGSATWSASLRTLSATPTDAIVHKSKLYFACGADFERYDGTNWTDGATLSGAVKATRYLLEWDAKLFILSNAGVLRYSTDEGVTWTTNASSTLESGLHTSLFNYRNASGTILPHMGTKIGLYILDFTNAKWTETELVFPPHDYACLGAVKWRESAYIPVGMGIYQYQTSNDPAIITPMGPDRDYGLPSDYRGNIIKLLNEHNALYALVDATSTEARDLYTGGYVIDGVFYDNLGFSAVLKWDGIGWSCVYLSGSQVERLKTAIVATADSIYRLWFAIDRSVFYIPLYENLANPLEVSGFVFAASGSHILPWFDADNAVVEKTAFKVSAYAEKTSATEYIKLYYGLNYDDNTWTLLTNTAFADGQIDTDGETSFTLASEAGLNFKALRFKAELYRGSTTTVTPDLRWLRLDYMKLPDKRWSYTAVVDCTKDYRHKRASTLIDNLKTAADVKTLSDFSFRTFQGTAETKKVIMLGMPQAVETGGLKKDGIFSVQLLEP